MTSDQSVPATAADLARIATFNATDAPFPDRVTLHALFEAQVARRGSATAMICDHDPIFGTQTLTYTELNNKVNQLAHRLRAEGVRAGDVVALMTDRSFGMIIGILAILKSGGAYLPISPDSPAERVAYLLSNGDARLLLGQAEATRTVPFGGTVIHLDDPAIFTGSIENPPIVNAPDDLAYVIYTSGSTGRPKGVMIEHRSVVNRLHWMQRAYPIGEADVLLQKTPYFFDVSVWELFWWALEGATLCFLAPAGEKNPLTLAATVRTHRVTMLHFVPSMLNVFLDYFEGKDSRVVRDLGSVRRVFASGEALTPSHVRKFNDVWGRLTGARLTNLYGPTEATVDVSYFDCPADNNVDVVPIGRPIDNTRFYVIRNGQQVAIGESGELCLAGVGLARGYRNNAGLTADKFVDNPVNSGERIYRTGDIARWMADGNVEYLGREDHQVKIRGLRIELGEIENTIREFAGVIDCVAVVKRYSETVILIVAYLASRPGFDLESLKSYLKDRLPDYMIPNRFVTLDHIPVTPSGKADRAALPEPVIDGSAS
ncbi:MAG: amino acid adenylation domain-containing protein [Vicinamibacterales bacterium]